MFRKDISKLFELMMLQKLIITIIFTTFVTTASQNIGRSDNLAAWPSHTLESAVYLALPGAGTIVCQL